MLFSSVPIIFLGDFPKVMTTWHHRCTQLPGDHWLALRLVRYRLELRCNRNPFHIVAVKLELSLHHTDSRTEGNFLLSYFNFVKTIFWASLYCLLAEEVSVREGGI